MRIVKSPTLAIGGSNAATTPLISITPIKIQSRIFAHLNKL
ncbi:MAG: hypothetical protein NZ937_06320 [Armatimonadetes bacterium]|nr:hypothetical protein [Armatimonadota bacterium]